MLQAVTCIYCYGRIIHIAYVCKAELVTAVASRVMKEILPSKNLLVDQVEPEEIQLRELVTSRSRSEYCADLVRGDILVIL